MTIFIVVDKFDSSNNPTLRTGVCTTCNTEHILVGDTCPNCLEEKYGPLETP